MRRSVGRKDSEHSERDGARATASPQPPSEPRGNCEKADNIQQETGYVDSDVEWDRMIRVRQRTVRRLQLERAASLRSSRGTEPAGRPAPPTFIRPRPPSRATLSHPRLPAPSLLFKHTVPACHGRGQVHRTRPRHLRVLCHRVRPPSLPFSLRRATKMAADTAG
jgi:hypothetical protein